MAVRVRLARHIRLISSVDRALVLYSKGRRFESGMSLKFAQSVRFNSGRRMLISMYAQEAEGILRNHDAVLLCIFFF